MWSFITISLCIVSVSALPQFNENDVDFRDERSVSSYIKETMAEVSQSIKDTGFDPYYLEKEGRNYELPVPVIFSSAYLIKELSSNGLSNIKVNSASYSFVSSRLNFDIELPRIDFGVGAASAESVVFGNTFKMNTSGKVEIQRMRFVGHLKLNVTLTTKPISVSVRSTKVKFTMKGIQSDVKLVAQDEDYSEKMNVFFNTTIPNTFKEYNNEINELLGIFLLDYASAYLKTQQN